MPNFIMWDFFILNFDFFKNFDYNKYRKVKAQTARIDAVSSASCLLVKIKGEKSNEFF